MCIQHPADFLSGWVLGTISGAGWAVPAAYGHFGNAVRLKANRPKAAAAFFRERIGQEPAIPHLTPDAYSPGIEVATHVRIAGVGTAAVDLQRSAVHLVTGLGSAGNNDAYWLLLSRDTQADGKLVKLWAGIVPVVLVNVGAGLSKCDGNGLHPGHQAGDNMDGLDRVRFNGLDYRQLRTDYGRRLPLMAGALLKESLIEALDMQF